MAAAPSKPGLRERKNLRTQRSIVRAAAELTLEGSFATATIARIAERADVAPRTVSTWFPAKDDIFFGDADELIARARQHLAHGDGDVIDRLQAWFADEAARTPDDHDDGLAQLRLKAISHDPELRATEARQLDDIHSMLVRAVQSTSGSEGFGAEMLAGAAMAMLHRLRSHGVAGDLESPQVREEMERGFVFLRAGLSTL